jgi:hypothetical protein
MQELAKAGDGWRVPPNPTPPDTPQADVEWLTERRVDMPIKCFETKLKLQDGKLILPRSYIYATHITPADTFGAFARRAQSEAGWRYHEIDASHSPNVTAPEALMRLLATTSDFQKKSRGKPETLGVNPIQRPSTIARLPFRLKNC